MVPCWGRISSSFIFSGFFNGALLGPVFGSFGVNNPLTARIFNLSELSTVFSLPLFSVTSSSSTYLPQSSPNSYFGYCVVPTSDTIVRCRERPSCGFSLAMLVPAPQERTETTSKRGLMNSFTGWVTGT